MTPFIRSFAPSRLALSGLAVTGLLAVSALSAAPASAASFDCNKARTPTERTICANRDLNDKDVKMAQLYEITGHLLAMGGRGALVDAQRDWVQYRNGCGANRACLTRAYDRRNSELYSILEQRVYTHAPF